MEEWSSHIIPEMDPSHLTHELFSAMRQCIEVYIINFVTTFSTLNQLYKHIAFMHSQNMVHLDISVRNILTDSKGHYAFIDHECSRILDIPFDADPPPRIFHFRATETPPESDRLEQTDPYKADVWALGILIQRACLVGFSSFC
jgi:serine/threonine protein kinase